MIPVRSNGFLTSHGLGQDIDFEAIKLRFARLLNAPTVDFALVKSEILRLPFLRMGTRVGQLIKDILRHCSQEQLVTLRNMQQNEPCVSRSSLESDNARYLRMTLDEFIEV